MSTPQTLADFDHDRVRSAVRQQYGQVALSKEGGCCAPGTPSSCCGEIAGTAPELLGYSADALAQVPEGAELGLGCGNPLAIASIKPGEIVVDLGSGGGVDCFLAARQTGAAGRVIGVDMTPEMLSRARVNAAKGSFANVEFRLGEIENLPLADNAADLIMSNCVINLSPDKRRVFRECQRVLKPGGRLAISDIVATAEIPEVIRRDMAAYAGCVAGAAHLDEVRRMLEQAGFRNIRIIPSEPSRAFINDWVPGHRAGDYVVSALIEAVK
jgi:arsenite methyltransferase